MKILVIDEWFPWPLDCGKKIRTFNLLKKLSRDFEILFMAYARLPEESEKLERLAGEGIRTIPVEDTRCPKWTPRFYAGVLFNLVSSQPFSTAYHIRSNFAAEIRRVVAGEKPALVHCEWTNLAPFLQHAGGIPQVIAAHNIESDIWKRLARNGENPLLRYVGHNQAGKIEMLERYWYPRVDRCLAVSPEDLAVIEGYGARAVLVENGVDVEHYASFPPTGEERALVFTASFDTFSNRDGAEFFVRDIWPQVKTAHPDLSLWLVGKNPSQRMIEFGQRDHRIVITGMVEDVRDYVAKAALSIVPLRIGGGSRLKILEAMAMGKAVVATTVGAEGIRAARDRDILIADHPSDFAGAIARGLANPGLRRSLGAAGLRLVRATYDWSGLARKQGEIWEAVAARRSFSRPGDHCRE